MAKVFSFLLVSLIWSSSTLAQYSQVKGVLKNQEKEKLDKAEKLLIKAIEKDSSLSAVLYAEASILFDSSYQHFNLDSAYRRLLKSKESFASLDEKSMEKHLKVGVDLLALDHLKKRIESAAFYRASLANSEEAYVKFLNDFSNTNYDKQAVIRRDSIAFSTAKKINTYPAYQAFMETYPDALQVKEAKRRYEKLYFDKNTADGKLESYIGFLEKHPATAYRKEAETKILEISTADNKKAGFLKFIGEYPVSALVPKAKRLLFYLSEHEFTASTDSVKRVIQLHASGPLTAVYESGSYGYIDSLGNVVIDAKYPDIKEEYLCRSFTEDFFITKGKIIARNGTTIFSGFFEDVRDMGMGVLEVITASRSFLVHKSGWPITNDKFQEVKRVGDYIGYKQSGNWGLMALTGLKLTRPRFDDIINAGEFYLFKFRDQFDVLNAATIAKCADMNPINFQALYSDYELLNTQLIWLQSDYGETIFDNDLNEVIPYNQQEIISVENGYIVSQNENIRLLDKEFNIQLETEGSDYELNSTYLKIKKEGVESLISLDLSKQVMTLDSIKLLGKYFAIAYREDSTFLFFKNDVRITKKGNPQFKLVASNSSAQYIAMKSSPREDWVVMNKNGNEIIKSDFDEITAIGQEYLVISKKNKKGLYSAVGQRLLMPKYDAIANYNNGYISFFSDKKFGLINDSLNMKIENDYDRNILPYNHKYLIVQKGDKIGLVDHKGQNITELNFEEIVFWNDSSALVKMNYQWLFLDIKANKLLAPALKSFQYVNSEDEKIIIGLVENRYGVYSSTRGEIIPPTFNDIINVGTSNSPIYFTEKHVEEAEFYIVIYYNSIGQLIRKQVFEADDYTLIYCED